MYKYKKVRKEVEELDKIICDSCGRKIRFGHNPLDIELELKTDWHLVKDYWQTQKTYHFCIYCGKKVFNFLERKKK